MQCYCIELIFTPVVGYVGCVVVLNLSSHLELKPFERICSESYGNIHLREINLLPSMILFDNLTKPALLVKSTL